MPLGVLEALRAAEPGQAFAGHGAAVFGGSSRGEAKDSALLSSRDAGLLEPPERPQGLGVALESLQGRRDLT